MKKLIFAGVLTVCAAVNHAHADKMTQMPKPPVESTAPVPVVNAVIAPPAPVAPPVSAVPEYVYEQKLVNDHVQLIPADQGQTIVDEFRTNYVKLGSPKFLIFVNRELVDDKSGLKLSGRTEKIVSNAAKNPDGKDSTGTKATVKNTYQDDSKAAPTLADRQTVRDVERLMGRPLRSAGATLVDQHVASQLIGSLTPGTLSTESEVARKDREAAAKVADVVIEVLISSRNITVREIVGEKNYTVPDIQMTAIRLSDAKILGQSTAGDVMNKAGGAAIAARNFTVQDITETTTLALMDDISQEQK